MPLPHFRLCVLIPPPKFQKTLQREGRLTLMLASEEHLDVAAHANLIQSHVSFPPQRPAHTHACT